MRESLREVLGWTGVGLVSLGLGWIYAPLTPIAIGCFLVFAAVRGR